MKHTILRALLIGMLLSIWSSAALAQKKSSGKKRVVYAKETTIRFDESLIEGKIIKPDGFFLLRQRPKRWQDLIKIRNNYDPELSQMKYEF